MALLKVSSLRKYFAVKKGLMIKPLLVRAVDGVDFSLDEDRIFALVGESGCGKSTVARLVLRLIPPTSGEVLFQGMNIFGFNGGALKAFRKSVQIIFQDPFASLNPRKSIMDTISEPLKIHRIVEKNRLKDKVVELLNKVGLGSDILYRYPHELSGGQRQRVCIARTLVVSPKVIVADEPLSALDVSIQAQILNLLQELKREYKISFLFISHDLRVVHYFSDTIGVMYLGKIVEYAKTEDLFGEPFHPYTGVLLSSAPVIPTSDTTHYAPRITHYASRLIQGEVPSPIDIPPGCPFHPRCPRRFEPCDKIVPELKEVDERFVSCHLY
ncbi:MAG: ATP-binding cassette domain-containing protein [Thermodesulfovibrionales bacterium]|nr:ATP-binding cassette domain-containing protein [Thermodesulfovibrionales bacterium]